MSTHGFPWHERASVIEAHAALAASFRLPTGSRVAAGSLELDYTPDLTAQEVTTVAGIIAAVVGATKARDVSLTVAEWQALAPFLDTGRALQQMSRAEWMALTDAERQRRTFDNLTALWRVVRALLRD